MWQRLPLSPRVLAVLLMIAGAAGFVLARVFFGEQVLCLFGSTLVTFIGLGLIVAARRKGWEEAWRRDHPQQEALRVGGNRPTGYVPRGLRSHRSNGRAPEPSQPTAEWDSRTHRTARPAQQPMRPQDALPQQEPYEPMPPLALRVMKILRQQGAQVVVDTRREDRCILQIQTQDGENYLAMVLEEDLVVDVPDLRALNALVTSSAFNGGYLITGGTFAQRAVDWSAGRPLRLLTRDELGLLTI